MCIHIYMYCSNVCIQVTHGVHFLQSAAKIYDALHVISQRQILTFNVSMYVEVGVKWMWAMTLDRRPKECVGGSVKDVRRGQRTHVTQEQKEDGGGGGVSWGTRGTGWGKRVGRRINTNFVY